jgi:hypothetical protein
VRPYPASEVPLRRFTIALCAALAAACFLTAPGWAATCGVGTYSYAGIGSRTFVSGVSATITPTAASTVWGGHVAGWVGVGGAGMGPHGTDEWMQIGLSASPEDATSRIYYEVTRPGHKPVYHQLRRNVGVGERHRVAVIELALRPGWWRVWLDGSPVSKPVSLPGSHATWPAQMVGESWSGKTVGTCNTYSYAFGHVSLASATNRAWGPIGRFDLFQDANYRLVRNSLSSFVAGSVAPVTRTPASPAP